MSYQETVGAGRKRYVLAGIGLSFGLAALGYVAKASEPRGPEKVGGKSATHTSADTAKSTAAFKQVAAVLRNPRCINCHTSTEFPRQGDDRHRHQMNVLRGPDNHGAVAMRCNACHQDINQKNGVPGAPNWGLAPLSMKWEGLSDHELAESLKDPSRNGQRSLEQLFDHMAHDELVGWAWHPGSTRAPVPISRDEFARQVRIWIDTGAASPE